MMYIAQSKSPSGKNREKMKKKEKKKTFINHTVRKFESDGIWSGLDGKKNYLVKHRQSLNENFRKWCDLQLFF